MTVTFSSVGREQAFIARDNDNLTILRGARQYRANRARTTERTEVQTAVTVSGGTFTAMLDSMTVTTFIGK